MGGGSSSGPRQRQIVRWEWWRGDAAHRHGQAAVALVAGRCGSLAWAGSSGKWLQVASRLHWRSRAGAGLIGGERGRQVAVRERTSLEANRMGELVAGHQGNWGGGRQGARLGGDESSRQVVVGIVGRRIA